MVLSDCRIPVLVAAIFFAGCGANFKDEAGKRLSLSGYDSIVVDEVSVADTVPHKKISRLLKANLKLELLESDKWHKTGDHGKVKEILAKSGRKNPFDYACEYEEEKRTREKKKWKGFSEKPHGQKPLRLNAEVTKVVFPSWSEMTVLGATCYAHCRVKLLDGNRKLGEATVFSAPEFPRLAIYTAGIVGVLSNVIRSKEYGDEDLVMLAENIAWETVKALDRARQYGESSNADTPPAADGKDEEVTAGKTMNTDR